MRGKATAKGPFYASVSKRSADSIKNNGTTLLAGKRPRSAAPPVDDSDDSEGDMDLMLASDSECASESEERDADAGSDQEEAQSGSDGNDGADGASDDDNEIDGGSDEELGEGDDSAFAEEGAGDDGDEDVAPLPIQFESERGASGKLPWRSSAYDFSRAKFADDLTGFVGLEEIPAGSYELVRKADGSISFAVKGAAGKAAAGDVCAGAAGAALSEGADKAAPSKQVAKVAAGADANAEAKATAKRAAADSKAAKGAKGQTQEAQVSGAKRKRQEDARQEAAAPAAPAARGMKEDEASVAVDSDVDCAASAATGRAGAGGGKRHTPAAPSTRASLPLAAVTAGWGHLGLHPALLERIAALGFPAPTRIQDQALPAAIRSYKDVVGTAETGSGKTLAYALPMLHRLLERRQLLGIGQRLDGSDDAAGAEAEAPSESEEEGEREGAKGPAGKGASKNPAPAAAAAAPAAAGGKKVKKMRHYKRKAAAAKAASAAPAAGGATAAGAASAASAPRGQPPAKRARTAAAANAGDSDTDEGDEGIAAAPAGEQAQPQRKPAAPLRRQWEYLPGLILVPTRELAMQVTDHINAVAKPLGIATVAIVGGFATSKQERQLRSRPDIVVATPGRLWDLMSAGGLDQLSALHKLQFLVLDEADRLCEKGHFAALHSILAALKPPPSADPSLVDAEAEAVIAAVERRDRAAAARHAAAAAGAAMEEDGAGSDDAESGDEAGAPAAEGPSHLVATPAKIKRQTFLFSATLGLSTGQSIRDAAKALLEARAHGAGASEQPAGGKGASAAAGGDAASQKAEKARARAAHSKASRRAYKRALEEASKLSPLELLMARVGLLGKPAVIKVEKVAAAPAAAAAAGAGVKGAAAAAATKRATRADAGSDEVGESEEEDEAEAEGEEEAVDAPAKAGEDAPLAASAAAGEATSSSAVSLPAGLRLARVSCGAEDKDEALYYFLLRYPGRTLLFVNAISTLRRVAALLEALQLPVHTLHASMQQRQRITHLERFRADPRAILIATDVAARGLDVPAVSYVIHYAMPHSAEAFVHRCGRTARASTAGLALALVGPDDQKRYARTMGALGMEEGLPEFPVDDRFARRLVARLSLARRIAVEGMKLNKDAAEQHWLVRTAAAAGVDVDAEEAGAGSSGTKRAGAAKGDDGAAVALVATLTAAGTAKAGRKQQKGRGGGGGEGEDVADAYVASQLARFSGDDAEEVLAAAHREAKTRRGELAGLRRQLQAMLAESLLPAGSSKRYITSNPLLSQGEHPAQALIRIEALPAAAGEGAVAPAAGGAATMPARHGSALVAPRVLMGSELDAPAPAAGRGGRGGAGKLAGLPGGAAGRAMIAGDGGGLRDAVNFLAAKGRRTVMSRASTPAPRGAGGKVKEAKRGKNRFAAKGQTSRR
jgi:superfamily II DNA/RNA helicase